MYMFGIDAFTDRAFSGNPAVVCLLATEADPHWMQQVAAEFGVSETAFVVTRQGGFGLRWFTPEVEVDLCGHATLAAAHVLWYSTGQVTGYNKIKFFTASGVLQAARVRDADGSEQIELEFPAEAPEPCELDPRFLQAIGVDRARYIGKNRLDYILELDHEQQVRELNPDFGALRNLPARGIITTAVSDSREQYDFVSRFFAPGAGIDEDPVTGSAHCCLGPYWQQKLGGAELLGYQASKRGGFVAVRPVLDKVFLRGTATQIWRGELSA
ncbi:MAG: PhzF family phenazine biosynthesis protein [Spirochaetaceae bacterium]|nr:MAG: PhzF family phenazine biosynthesis protein [Spirochaetaceae bacterium]